MKKIQALLIAFITLWVTTAFAEPQLLTLTKGNKTIHLFGTIHVTKPNFYPLPKQVLSAIETADTVAIEIDMSDPKVTEETMQAMIALGMNPNQNLSEILTAAEIEKIDQLLGLAAMGMKKLHPVLLAITLEMVIAEEQGFIGEAVDLFIAQHAKSKQIQVIGLETATEQINAILSTPENEAKKYLKRVLSEDEINELADIGKWWLDNDQAIAARILNEMKEDFPHLYQHLLINRNKTMAQRIEKLSDNHKQLFVGIGAAHLYGKDSVIDCLLKAGYQRQ